jgi:hypothetical protein
MDSLADHIVTKILKFTDSDEAIAAWADIAKESRSTTARTLCALGQG